MMVTRRVLWVLLLVVVLVVMPVQAQEATPPLTPPHSDEAGDTEATDEPTLEDIPTMVATAAIADHVLPPDEPEAVPLEFGAQSVMPQIVIEEATPPDDSPGDNVVYAVLGGLFTVIGGALGWYASQTGRKPIDDMAGRERGLFIGVMMIGAYLASMSPGEWDDEQVEKLMRQSGLDVPEFLTVKNPSKDPTLSPSPTHGEGSTGDDPNAPQG